MLGEKLRRLRLSKGSKQDDIAGIIGISLSAYANYETGKSMPPLDKLVALADYHGVSLDWLCGVENTVVGTKLKTWADVAGILTALLASGHFIVETHERPVPEGMRSFAALVTNSHDGISYQPTAADRFLSNYAKMSGLLQESLITEEIFDGWLDSVLRKLGTEPLEG